MSITDQLYEGMIITAEWLYTILELLVSCLLYLCLLPFIWLVMKSYKKQAEQNDSYYKDLPKN